MPIYLTDLRPFERRFDAMQCRVHQRLLGHVRTPSPFDLDAEEVGGIWIVPTPRNPGGAAPAAMVRP